jgi:holin-like protein
MKFMKQLSIILAVSFIAELMEYLIPLPVAASVYGLLLMLLGLVTKVIPLEKVEGAADFLVEIMPILFVPPTVSIMTSVEAMKQMMVPLCVISVVSTILIMTVTGRTAQAILRAGRRKNRSEQGGKADE